MQRTLGAVAGLMASAMLLLKALVGARGSRRTGGGLGQEWKTGTARAAACIGMLLGLAPGAGWHLWHAHTGSGALWLWGGDGAGRVLLMLAKAVIWAGGSR